MLSKLELYEVQDKVRLVEELNEVVDAVNSLEKSVKSLRKVAPNPSQETIKSLEKRLVKLEGRVEGLMKEPIAKVEKK